MDESPAFAKATAGAAKLKFAHAVNFAVIPSEVEAATQPRKLSGRGQAFHPDAKPTGLSAGFFDSAALRSE